MQTPSLSAEKAGELDQKFGRLIDQFEQEVAPYDRLTRFAAIGTFGGVIVSILIPILYLQFVANVNPYHAFMSGPAMYFVIGGIVASKIVPRLLMAYSSHKKHKISRTKYKPVTGVCMCDLYQFRTHLQKMEKASTAARRIRHAKLASYYKQKMGS